MEIPPKNLLDTNTIRSTIISSYFYFLTIVRLKKNKGEATTAQKWFLEKFPILFAVPD